jgi:hypothetical protein
MIFVDKNIDPFMMKQCVYALHAYTCLHKKFGTILINITWLINLSMFKCLL